MDLPPPPPPPPPLLCEYTHLILLSPCDLCLGECEGVQHGVDKIKGVIFFLQQAGLIIKWLTNSGTSE